LNAWQKGGENMGRIIMSMPKAHVNSWAIYTNHRSLETLLECKNDIWHI